MFAVFVLLAGACGSGDSDSAAQPAETNSELPLAEFPEDTPADLSQIDGCLEDGEDGEVVEFESEGIPLRGIVTGKGKTGVLLAHQFGGNLCQWWSISGGFIKELTSNFTVMAFDFRGNGDSGDADSSTSPWTPDVIAAAEELTAHGVDEIVLVGASAGGGATFEAAPRVDNAIALIGLAPAIDFFAADPAPVLPDIDVPTLIMVDKQDTDFYKQAKGAFPKVGAVDKTFEAGATTGHGKDMLGYSEGRKIFFGWLYDHT